MAKHDHKICAHDEVKYCKTCQVCHCLNCAKEWTNQPQYYWYNYPYTWLDSGGTGYPTKIYGISNASDNQTTAGGLIDIPAPTCKHGL